MKNFVFMFLILTLLSTGSKGCEIPEMTPEDRERIEREWDRQQEKERIEENMRPDDWRRYIN